MGYIRMTMDGSVAALTLDRGVTNPINLDLVAELSDALEEITSREEIRGVTLGSANDKFFSIGFDIPELYPLDRDGFKAFYQAFNRLCVALYALPKPVVAALTGHAVAGGCIVALACDYRFIAAGRKLMGLNEIKLGVPIPYPADCMLHDLVGTRTAREFTDTGDFFEADDLLARGAVDRVLPLDAVRGESLAWCRQLADAPGTSFARIKSNRTERVTAPIMRHLAEKEAQFVESWYAEETRRQLREAMENFRGR